MDPISIQPLQPAGSRQEQAGNLVEIELDRQPGRANIDQCPPKKPANVLGMAGNILSFTGRVVMFAAFAPILAPGYLLGSALANGLSFEDEKNRPPLLGMMLSDVIDEFKPFTKDLTAIKASYEGKTVKEYKKDQKTLESYTNSMQLRQYIHGSREQAKQLPNQPAVDAATINTKDPLGLTPLMKAETAATVHEYIAMDANVSEIDAQGLTALNRFASLAEVELVDALLSSNKVTFNDCFHAQLAVGTTLKYEPDPNERRKYEDIMRALTAYRPPRPLPQAPPPNQNQGQPARDAQVQPPQQQVQPGRPLEQIDHEL